MFANVGFIGSGQLTQALAPHLVAARVPVLISNSRGPDSLTELGGEFGDAAQAVTMEQAAKADVAVVDGARVKTADGWWLLRASNTQDVLVARAEGRDQAALERLKGSLAEQLKAFRHHGFWHPVDTLRDKRMLEQLWSAGNPPWKVWT